MLGFAHIGLLMALEEARLPVDRIAGTSAGAIVAALHAFGVAPHRTRALLAPLTWRNVSNFSRNSLGLLSNEPLAEVLQGELGDARIEDAGHADVIIEPDLVVHNHRDLEQRDELIEKGREGGRAALDAIRTARAAFSSGASGGSSRSAR